LLCAVWFVNRHNSVALDLAVGGPASGAYTLMGPELGTSTATSTYS
jgi:hypothetical protein